MIPKSFLTNLEHLQKEGKSSIQKPLVSPLPHTLRFASELREVREHVSQQCYSGSGGSDFRYGCIGLVFILLIIAGICYGCSALVNHGNNESASTSEVKKQEPFKLPNPEVLFWVNGAELSAFIGGDKKECNGFNEESKAHWFLTRVDLTVFNVRTNGTQIIITRKT